MYHGVYSSEGTVGVTSQPQSFSINNFSFIKFVDYSSQVVSEVMFVIVVHLARFTDDRSIGLNHSVAHSCHILNGSGAEIWKGIFVVGPAGFVITFLVFIFSWIEPEHGRQPCAWVVIRREKHIDHELESIWTFYHKSSFRGMGQIGSVIDIISQLRASTIYQEMRLRRFSRCFS